MDIQQEIAIRLEGGRLHGQRFLVEGPTPPETVEVWDIMGAPRAVYLRTYSRFSPNDDTWKYIPSDPSVLMRITG